MECVIAASVSSIARAWQQKESWEAMRLIKYVPF
jgi:hypothetical protein